MGGFLWIEWYCQFENSHGYKTLGIPALLAAMTVFVQAAVSRTADIPLKKYSESKKIYCIIQ